MKLKTTLSAYFWWKRIVVLLASDTQFSDWRSMPAPRRGVSFYIRNWMKLGTKVASIGISFREIFQKKNEWGSPLRMKSDGKCHLHNCFNLHVCPSFRRRRRRPTFNFQIPAVVSQSVTNESCLICVKSEKYSFLGTTRPLGSMRWGEAELHTLKH